MGTPLEAPVFSHAQGSDIYTVAGERCLDLVMGFGSAFLGHAHPRVTARLQEQAGRLLNCARQPTDVGLRADELVARILPSGMRLGGFCSTGMEVAEFAMRVAATHTGRSHFAGFAHSMHGRSAMTAGLCWENAAIHPQHLHMLPFVDAASEAAILESLATLLRKREVAALFIEPIQGSHGACEASLDFYREAIALCRECGTLCVFDEILTGLYRTGPTFYSDRLDARPDVMLFAKCIGNGFPVTALALAPQVAIKPQAFAGSTFAANPLAMAAVEGTLTAMQEMPMQARVESFGRIIGTTLAGLREAGATLRGRGAIWCLDLGPRIRAGEAIVAIRAAGVLVGSTAGVIRLLPAATLEPERLQDACRQIVRACEAACAPLRAAKEAP
jgi:acetylornithine/succinyldiaminopimelate/putrescine aminotransferase